MPWFRARDIAMLGTDIVHIVGPVGMGLWLIDNGNLEELAQACAAHRRWEQDKALPAGETFDASFDELARDRFIIGDPARVVDEIARYRERLGVTTMIFRLQWPGMDQEKVLRSIRLLGHKVLLKFLSG